MERQKRHSGILFVLDTGHWIVVHKEMHSMNFWRFFFLFEKMTESEVTRCQEKKRTNCCVSAVFPARNYSLTTSEFGAHWFCLIQAHHSMNWLQLSSTLSSLFFGNFQIFPPNSISCRFERSRPLLKFWTELSPGRLLIGCGAINHGMGAHSGGMATCSIIHNCRHRRRRPATMAQQKRKRPPGRNVSLAAEIMARKAEEGDRAIDTHL